MSNTATLVETRLTIDGTEADIQHVLTLLDDRISAHDRYLFGVPLTSARYEVLGNTVTGTRNGVPVGEARMRLVGTQADVEALVAVIARHASHRG